MSKVFTYVKQNKREIANRQEILAEKARNPYTIPINDDTPVYNIKAMYEYCRNHGMSTSDITPEQMEQFRVR